MQQKNAGFTLIEMMVAIVIGSIMTMMALPNFNRMREIYRLRGATQEVYVSLQRARMAAIKENNGYRVYLTGGTTIVLHDDLNNDGIEDVGEPKIQKNVAADALGISMTGMSAASAVTFRQNGTATISGGISTITVTNASGYSKQLIVSPAGRITIS
jgi:type IV fimbrial biogenesis protein FimT